jgi:hypothetical protein
MPAGGSRINGGPGAVARQKQHNVDNDERLREARVMILYGLRLAGQPVPANLDELDAARLTALARRHENGGTRRALALLVDARASSSQTHFR